MPPQALRAGLPASVIYSRSCLVASLIVFQRCHAQHSSDPQVGASLVSCTTPMPSSNDASVEACHEVSVTFSKGSSLSYGSESSELVLQDSAQWAFTRGASSPRLCCLRAGLCSQSTDSQQEEARVIRGVSFSLCRAFRLCARLCTEARTVIV